MSKDCCAIEKVDLEKKENETLQKVFWAVLIINLVMFFVEAIGGYVARSNALLADSLDMLGDVFVYSLSLFVLFRGHQAKVNASLVKGGLMFLLGLLVVGEAVHRVINPVQPVAEAISLIGGLALIANALCLLLLVKHKNADLNVKSAWLCSRNDVVANASVILAGILVGYFNSMWPDILIGLGIAFVVLRSSIGIIREGIEHKKEAYQS